MCSNVMNKLENISLDEFKKQLETLDSFVTDPQWLEMLKYDMALNSDLASKLCNYIIYIKNNRLDAESYERLMLNIRQECELKIQEAIDEGNPVTKWYKYREAYAYYGFIETITEGSIITEQILETFRQKYGKNYLNVLKDIDTINPSNLTNFDLSSDNISSYKGEEVKLYVLMKYWQDDQHVFHENKLHPKHQEARKAFEKVVRKELPSLNDVTGKNLLALYLINNTDILSINVLSRFILGGLDNDLALIVGGKNLGLARLNAHGFEIPETYFISVNSLEKKLYLPKLKELKDYNYSVRSSATVEDNEKSIFCRNV